MGVVVNATPQPLKPWKIDGVTTVQEAGWSPAPVWTGTENFDPSEFDPQTVLPVISHSLTTYQ